MTPWSRRARFSVRPAVLLCLSLLIVASCGRHSPPSAARSGISVSVTGNGVVVTTSSAKFELTPAGYLKASLTKDGQYVSLDDPGSEGSDFVVSNGKPVDDFHLDLSAAKVTDGAGRLDTRGKTIEVAGRSASIPSLEKQLTIEVADAFPQMAFTTVAYKNTGGDPVRLEQVVAQRHRVNASQVDSQAKPYEMWSFSGAS